jgi:hypothetical protein
MYIHSHPAIARALAPRPLGSCKPRQRELSDAWPRRRRSGKRARRRSLALVGAAVAVALAVPIAAHADAPSDGATVSRDVTQTIPYTNPCTGENGTLTVTYTEVINTVGSATMPTFHATSTLVGDFTLVEPREPVTTGHFVTHGSFEGIPNGTPSGAIGLMTVEAHGTTADGSQYSLHFVTLSFGVPPEVTVKFEHCA